ncbi:MFS transporter [Amycolatopsis sp. NPDC005232]|uniref:MFS transporter n=1 Tax=Amycolatopsis sp. NPDC005232 TaxID=3157027 RepID=UPI0033AF7079
MQVIAPTADRAERAAALFARPRVSHTTGFWAVAASFTTLMAFATVTAPLWPLYQQRDHFDATTVTVAFAAMVLGTAAGFTLLGHLSDRFGRRAGVVSGLLVGVAGAGIMAASPVLPALIIGRVLTGLAVGLMASTATAYLGELHLHANHARRGSAFPGLVATTANLGGLALGPITGGVLAAWAPLPLHTSFLVLAGLMTALTVVVVLAPETVERSAHSEGRPERFALLPGARSSFAGAAAVGFFALALLGLFSSLSGVIVREELHTASILVVGLVPFTAFGASAAAQIALRRLPHIRLLTTGSMLFPMGLALIALSLYEPHAWLLLIAAGLAGGGAGLLFKGGLTETVRLAKPSSRAGVLAMFFAIAYLGMGLPSILFSVVIRHAALQQAMVGFASILTAGAVAAVVTAAHTHRRD